MKAARRNWLARLSLANLLLLLALFAAEQYIGEGWWLTTLLAYAPQQPLGLPTLILLVTSLLRREWRGLAYSLAALALFLTFFLGLSLARPPADSPGTPLRVMTLNLHSLTRVTPEDLVALLRTEDIDLACFQEASPAGSEVTSSDLLEAFAGWHTASNGEICIVSKYPLISHSSHPLAVDYRVALTADIATPGRTVTVVGVHFVTAARPESLRRTASLSGYLRRTARIRLQQAEELLTLTGRAGAPVLVLGDFNTPPRGRVYRLLTTTLQDGFRAAGRGTGYTFPSDRPVLRIDYVLASPEVIVERCRVLPTDRSDHLPVIADLRIAPDPGA